MVSSRIQKSEKGYTHYKLEHYTYRAMWIGALIINMGQIHPMLSGNELIS